MGRISGNEFVVLIDGLLIEESLDFVEWLCQDFEDQEFVYGEVIYWVMLSVSVCLIISKVVFVGDLFNVVSLLLKLVK